MKWHQLTIGLKQTKELNNMQAKKNEQNGMQNVYITVSNALDQSDKQRIEVAKDLTVEQAIRQQGLAPAGKFDVFDATGRVITNENVAQLAEENVYVGVQKVAGGADWDAGWGGGAVIAVEPAADLDLVNELPSKGVCFVSSFNDDSRNTVIPRDNDTIQDAAKASGLIPRDGSAWDVYDGMGRVVTNEPSNNYIGQTLWINASAIGGGGFEKLGLTENELQELQVLYPSIQAIKHLRLGTGRVGGFILNLKGVVSHQNSSEMFYRIIIDVRGFPLQKPHAFVLSPDDEGIHHCNIYHENNFSILPSKQICAICDGEDANHTFENWPHDRAFRIRAWLNHIQSVLCNPNTKSRARSV
jgi:hypothetical protein